MERNVCHCGTLRLARVEAGKLETRQEAIQAVLEGEHGGLARAVPADGMAGVLPDVF